MMSAWTYFLLGVSAGAWLCVGFNKWELYKANLKAEEERSLKNPPPDFVERLMAYRREQDQ